MGKRWFNGLFAKANRNVRVRYIYIYIYIVLFLNVLLKMFLGLYL